MHDKRDYSDVGCDWRGDFGSHGNLRLFHGLWRTSAVRDQLGRGMMQHRFCLVELKSLPFVVIRLSLVDGRATLAEVC